MNGRDRVIDELRTIIANQAVQLERQAAQLDEQAARIGELELALAKAKKDSSTSSKPPSSDIVKPKPKQKKPVSMISRRTTSASCLPKVLNRQIITAKNKSATA